MPMGILKQLGIFASVCSAFFLFGHVLPKLTHVDPASFTIGAKPKEEKPAIVWTSKVFEDSLAASIPVKTRITKKRKNAEPKEFWYVGKGISLPVYLLKAQRAIQTMGGQVDSMKEIDLRQTKAMLAWSDTLGTSKSVEIILSDEFQQGSSSLAIGFTVDSNLSIPELNALNTLARPFSLLIRPLDSLTSLLYDLDKLPKAEPVIWLGMEPHRYPWINPGPRSVLIHHNSKEIATVIEQASKRIPKAVGIASRMGERAVEHKPLLEAVLHTANKHGFFFLDLTQSRFSKTLEACSELKASCKSARQLKPGEDVALYLKKALSTSLKSGQEILLLPISEDNIKAVAAILPDAESQGTEIVTLSILMNQSE